MSAKKYKISQKEVNLFLFLLPISALILFWLKVFFGQSLEIGSYFNFIVMFALFRVLLYTFPLFLVVNIVVFVSSSVFYSTFYGINFNECASYITSLNNVLLASYVFTNVDYSDIDLRLLKRHLIVFGYLFVIFYELSTPYAKVRSFEDDFYGNSRSYKEGFVISHLASYYLAVLSYFLYTMKVRWHSLFFSIYVLTLGARIGMIYLVVGVVFGLVFYKPYYYFILRKLSVKILCLLLSLLMLTTVSVLYYLGYDQLNVITSGRAKIWYNAIFEISNWNFSKFILGEGPKESIQFNGSASDISVWMHNDFLDIFFNLGFVGFIIFLAFVFYFVSRSRSIYFVLIFVFSAFFNGFFLYDPIFVIILSAMMLLYRREKSKSQDSNFKHFVVKHLD